MSENAEKICLVAVSDLRLSKGSSRELHRAIADLNALDQEITFLLGDYRTEPNQWRSLNSFRGTLLPTLGDGDLSVSDDPHEQSQILAEFAHTFQKSHHYYSYDRFGIFFITLSPEPHQNSKDQFYVSQEQIDWFESELRSNPLKPTIVQCHAPISGVSFPILSKSLLETASPAPKILTEIARQNPQIIIWLSGHLCLGQHYARSVCKQHGIHFAHVGTFNTRSTLDGSRHSRVIEIHLEKILIRTFDHDQRRILPKFDYQIDGNIFDLPSICEVSDTAAFCETERSGIHIGTHGLQIKTFPTTNYLTYLERPAIASVHAICPAKEKIYIATTDHYVWEFDRKSGLPIGAVFTPRNGRNPRCVWKFGPYLFVGANNQIWKIQTDQPNRFARNRRENVGEKLPIRGAVNDILRIDDDPNGERVFVASNRKLYEIDPFRNQIKLIEQFPKPIFSIQKSGDYIYVLTKNRLLYRYGLRDLQRVDHYQLPTHANFLHVTDSHFYVSAHGGNETIKISKDELEVEDQLTISGPIQTIIADDREIYILMKSAKIFQISIDDDFSITAERQLEMRSASTMTLDDQFLFVGSANPERRWQEVQIIERRTDQIGEIAFEMRTAETINPILEIEEDLSQNHRVRIDLFAKNENRWIDLREEYIASDHFSVRLKLSAENAENSDGSIVSVRILSSDLEDF